MFSTLVHQYVQYIAFPTFLCSHVLSLVTWSIMWLTYSLFYGLIGSIPSCYVSHTALVSSDNKSASLFIRFVTLLLCLNLIVKSFPFFTDFLCENLFWVQGLVAFHSIKRYTLHTFCFFGRCILHTFFSFRRCTWHTFCSLWHSYLIFKFLNPLYPSV